MDNTDLALLFVAVRAGALADMLREIIGANPSLSDELIMAACRLDGVSAEVEQVLMGGLNRGRSNRTHSTGSANQRTRRTRRASIVH